MENEIEFGTEVGRVRVNGSVQIVVTNGTHETRTGQVFPVIWVRTEINGLVVARYNLRVHAANAVSRLIATAANQPRASVEAKWDSMTEDR